MSSTVEVSVQDLKNLGCTLEEIEEGGKKILYLHLPALNRVREVHINPKHTDIICICCGGKFRLELVEYLVYQGVAFSFY